jgi:hypothetical protein
VEYRGDVFHLDHVSGGVFRAHLANNVVAGHELFYQAEGGPVDLVADRDGNLLYAELFTGRVRKISYPAFSTVDPTPEPDADSVDTPQPAHVACGTGAMAALCVSFFVCIAAMTSRSLER